MTQAEFAEKVGMSRASIARYESGSESTTLETIAQIAQALNISETALLTDPKTSSEDYKAYYELSMELKRLKDEKQNMEQLSDPISREIISLLATLNEEKKGQVLVAIRAIISRNSSSSFDGNKIK